MIRVLDHHNRPTPPAWLVGATDLQSTQHRDGMLWGIGSGLDLVMADGQWRDIGDGYSVDGQQDPRTLARASAWYDRAFAVDGNGMWWPVPQILNAKGTRNFRVRYGHDWLPALTPEQVRAEQIARLARDALTGGTDLDLPIACQWSAELMSVSAHVTPAVIAALNMLDDVLMAQVLAIAAGVAEVSDG